MGKFFRTVFVSTSGIAFLQYHSTGDIVAEYAENNRYEWPSQSQWDSAMAEARASSDPEVANLPNLRPVQCDTFSRWLLVPAA